MANVGRFVAASADGLRRHIRTIRFDQDTVEGDSGGDANRFFGVFKGQWAVKTDIKSEFKAVERLLITAGNAVEYTAQRNFFVFFSQDGEGITHRVAAMDDDRQIQRSGETELTAENVALILFDFAAYQKDLQFECISFTVTLAREFSDILG